MFLAQRFTCKQFGPSVRPIRLFRTEERGKGAATPFGLRPARGYATRSLPAAHRNHDAANGIVVPRRVAEQSAFSRCREPATDC